MPPMLSSMGRLEYIHAMVQQLPVFGTKNLATKREKDMKEKTGVDVSIPRFSVIGQDEYAYYTASLADVAAPPVGKPFSVATVTAGTKIGAHYFSISLTRLYDADSIYQTMFTESKAIARDFLHVNPY